MPRPPVQTPASRPSVAQGAGVGGGDDAALCSLEKRGSHRIRMWKGFPAAGVQEEETAARWKGPQSSQSMFCWSTRKPAQGAGCTPHPGPRGLQAAPLSPLVPFVTWQAQSLRCNRHRPPSLLCRPLLFLRDPCLPNSIFVFSVLTASSPVFSPWGRTPLSNFTLVSFLLFAPAVFLLCLFSSPFYPMPALYLLQSKERKEQPFTELGKERCYQMTIQVTGAPPLMAGRGVCDLARPGA